MLLLGKVNTSYGYQKYHPSQCWGEDWKEDYFQNPRVKDHEIVTNFIQNIPSIIKCPFYSLLYLFSSNYYIY